MFTADVLPPRKFLRSRIKVRIRVRVRSFVRWLPVSVPPESKEALSPGPQGPTPAAEPKDSQIVYHNNINHK